MTLCQTEFPKNSINLKEHAILDTQHKLTSRNDQNAGERGFLGSGICSPVPIGDQLFGHCLSESSLSPGPVLTSSLPHPFIAPLNQIHGHHALSEVFVVLHKGLGRQFSPELIGLCDDSLL